MIRYMYVKRGKTCSTHLWSVGLSVLFDEVEEHVDGSQLLDAEDAVHTVGFVFMQSQYSPTR